VIALVVAVVIGPPVPAVAGELPGDELIEIGGKVENAPTRSRPLTPNNEVFYELGGPRVGLVDRLRDKLADHDSGGLGFIKVAIRPAVIPLAILVRI
jgi:hypothetical protein